MIVGLLLLIQYAMATAQNLTPTSAQWKVMVDELKPLVMKEATWALQQAPITITAYSSPRSSGDIHDFFSEGDYWWPNPVSADSPYIQKDGLTNPDNFVAHRLALMRFSSIMGALASAYRLTGNNQYVMAAMQHCKAWFVDTATFMRPHLLYAQAIKGRFTGRGIGIIDTIHFLEVVQAMLAMEKSEAANQEIIKVARSWFEKYLIWLQEHPYGKAEQQAENNHGTCWLLQVACFARFTSNAMLTERCRQQYEKILLAQMNADGSFPRELKRTKPYGYSLFNLDAFATLTQILSTPEKNYWRVVSEEGKGIQKGIAFLYPYVQNKNSWPFAHDVMYWNNWPVAHPFLLFGAIALGNTDWMETWRKLDHAPDELEIIRNLPVRHPLIWWNNTEGTK
ncbi:MAG: alginate lyase family protein [Sediminibacterium sp.]|nr:alginate lyase family protein [Sediminibacterium sp.]